MKGKKKHKYTQAEFDAFPVIDGEKQCPTGDYTEIKHFGESCSFEGRCSFGVGCSFGAWCSFGGGCTFKKGCSFGENGSFGKSCSFGEHCSFDRSCSFGGWCTFKKGCSFDEHCSFGEHCSFDKHCSFSEYCSFKKGCVCEFGEFSQMCSFGGFGRKGRTTYAFALTDGSIGIRCGCFTGNLDKFRAKVKKTHGDSKLGKNYLAIADLVSSWFGEV